MSGFLDSKQRIIDTVITQEGRRQLASGRMVIKFATFTDGATFYARDSISGSSDSSSRIYLEAASLPQDQITFEADDSGLLMPFKNSQEASKIAGGNILSGSTFVSSSVASLAGALLTASLDSFKNQQIIGTENRFFDESTFEVDKDSVTFELNQKAASLLGKTFEPINVDDAESLFADKRLSRLSNFQFLPPINKKANDADPGTPLGEYVLPRNQNVQEIEKEIKDRLIHLEQNSYSEKINFVEGSRNNNIVSQFFSVEGSTLKKLDVIDYGPLELNKGGENYVYFVGSLLTDSNGMPTFINLFTVIFE